MLGKKRPSVIEPRPAPARVDRPKLPVATLVRMFLLGSVAVIAAIWALWRHYTVPHARMLVPVQSAPASSSEIDIEP